MTYALNLDFETRATVDLTTVGAHVYARHKDTRVLCASYSLDGGRTLRRWETWRGKLMPKDLAIALGDPECMIEAWNANFERLILQHVLRMKIPIERFRCTMARARSMALPGKLELCARALSMPVQKADSSIMLKWCKPLKDGGWAQDEKEYDELLAYCDVDVQTEAGLGNIVRDLSGEEWRDYHINEAINDRGIPVDLDLARAAQRYAKDELHEICDRLNTLTKGAVSSPKQFARIKDWLEKYLPDEAWETVFLDEKGEPKTKVSFDAATREELLGDDTKDILSGDVREFVELIHDGGRASSAKFSAMLARGVNAARVYGSFVFNGAGQTGRFSGTGVQTQNLIRDKLENIEQVVEAILKGVPKEQLQDVASYRPDGSFVFDKSRDEYIKEPYNVLTILGRTLKAAIVADEGKTLVSGDWKSIEAVVNPWLSQENSANELLEYFGSGKDIYVRQAALTYGVPESEVTRGQRQAGGKVPILSFGFGGGAGAIMRMARAYNVTLDEKTAEHLKRNWRQSNPWAPNFWSNLEIAAYQAVRRPETVYEAGRVKYMMANDVLWCLLPSGRPLAYPFARISLRPNQWGEEQEVVTCMKGSFHPKKGTSHWPTMQLWGGIQCENCCSGETEVLTPDGWCRISEVGARKVWDGIEFVTHAGLVYQGEQHTTELDGVWLTDDHLVLTSEGWQRAEICEGLYRCASRVPYDAARRRVGRETPALGSAMHLRQDCLPRWTRASAQQDKILRLHAGDAVDSVEEKSWYGAASRVLRLALHVRSLPTAVTSRLGQLWRSRHQGMSSLAAIFRKFLDRYGAHLSVRAYAGPHRQQRQLHLKELSLGYISDAGRQYAAQQNSSDTVGTYDCSGSCPPRGLRFVNTVLQGSSRFEPVYDLRNCGPRKRFVVRGRDAPFIVHNCTQGEAASLLRWGVRELWDNGWPLIGHTHDDIMLEIEESEADEAAAVLRDVMTTGPAWAAGLPLLADISMGYVLGQGREIGYGK